MFLKIMKKIAPLVFTILLAGLLLPMISSAQMTTAPASCKLKYEFASVDPACTEGSVVDISEHGMCCLLNTVYSVTDWIFIILVGLATIFVMLGAVTILTAGGTPEKLTTGRNYILYAAIGLLIAFLAKAIPGIVKLLAGIQ